MKTDDKNNESLAESNDRFVYADGQFTIENPGDKADDSTKDVV